MTEFIVAARLDQVPPGSGMSFTVADKQIAIFNVDGTVYAMDDSCLHKGASLGAGQLAGKVGHLLSGYTAGATMSPPEAP